MINPNPQDPEYTERFLRIARDMLETRKTELMESLRMVEGELNDLGRQTREFYSRNQGK